MNYSIATKTNQTISKKASCVFIRDIQASFWKIEISYSRKFVLTVNLLVEERFKSYR